MCQPWLLIPQLPDFPYKGWTRMEASRESDGSLIPKLLFEALPAAETIWHPKSIDAVSLEKVRRHRSGVYGVLYSGLPTICQIICFAWQVPRIEHRTYAYPMIEEYRGLGDPVVPPAFLGHVTEKRRVIRYCLRSCRATLRRWMIYRRVEKPSRTPIA
ncbi:hypothetical protein B0O99DRAFT_322086 [Bisporella sp. PMI_857]|nr:hypothetical protein B0O99DRAFT_322086 [Bisporella sp. PMI_857]